MRLQRKVLAEKQQLLARAMRAITDAEEAFEIGKPADPGIFKRLIEVIDMQDGIEVMKRYYSEEVWVKLRHRYEQGPLEDWKELYRDVGAALAEDPASETAQALAARWMGLMHHDSGGDPEIQAAAMAAWVDRENWPDSMRQRIAKYHLDKFADFIGEAFAAPRKQYYSPETWSTITALPGGNRAEGAGAGHALFRDVAAAVDGGIKRPHS